MSMTIETATPQHEEVDMLQLYASFLEHLTCSAVSLGNRRYFD
jgi:hypothetical protein